MESSILDFIVFAFFVSAIVSLVRLIISIVRKDEKKKKKNMGFLVASLALPAMIAGVSSTGAIFKELDASALTESLLGEDEESDTAAVTPAADQETADGEEEDTAKRDALRRQLGETYYLTFMGAVDNDSTGDLRWASYSGSENSQQEIALDYYKACFDDDSEIHALWNANDGTIAKLTVSGDTLDVEVHEYVQGEEHDANKLFGGEELADYHVNLKDGSIDQVL